MDPAYLNTGLAAPQVNEKPPYLTQQNYQNDINHRIHPSMQGN
jgi:hypothetical protein